MRKGIFKLMSAAAVATALVSCSDDLSFSSNQQKDADLTATIENTFPVTRMGMLETGTAPYEDQANSNWGLAWTKGDQIRVFTVNQLTFDYYELLPSSADQLEGQFKLTQQNLDQAALVGDKLYAITDAQFAYGVSCTREGEARLTYTIPYRWNASKTQGEGVDVRKFPAPYWGLATKNGSTIDVGTTALTAFIRVDMAELPKDTKYVVFTTHGNKMNIKDKNDTGAEYTVEDGFLLADPDTWTDANDTRAWWYKQDTENKYVNAQFINDGKSEPLAGTFNAILDAENPKKSWLKVDEGLGKEANANVDEGDKMYEESDLSRLVTRDEIVVTITPNTPAVFYVPIIVRGGDKKFAKNNDVYENLHVIAATKLSKYTYCYVGTEIYNYHQEPFYRGQYKFLSLNYQNLGEVCPAELNKAIAEANKRADRTSILNVDKLIKCTHVAHTRAQNWDLKKYPVNRINVAGTGKLVLNLNAIEDNAGADYADATGAVVTNKQTNSSPALYVTSAKAVPTGKIDDKVTINLPKELGETTYADNPAMLVDLPAYNVVIGSVNGKDLTKWTAYVKGSKTKCVTGKNTLLDGTGENLKKISDAGINVVAGLKALNVLEGTTGDVFVNQIANYEPEILSLNVQTTNQIDILITNGLVENLNFVNRTPSSESFVYTTGSSAIQKVQKITLNNAADAQNAYEVTVGTGIPSNVSMYSYWTGAALSQKALKTLSGADDNAVAAKDYDQQEIYTVAQLASVGEKDQAKYNIPHLLVKDMWLGAQTYPWIGALATVAAFELDGENVPLRKLSFQDQERNPGAGPYYVDDPHMCCTTCGWKPAIYSNAVAGDLTPLTSLGLIRSYKSTAADAAIIKNVNVSDVYFNTETAFDNIGSIIGEVVTEGAFTMQDNNVTEPKFEVAGDNIGGMAGSIKAAALTITNNNIKDTDNESGYIKSKKSNVGGLAGNIEATGATKINNNNVDLKGNIQSSKSYVGGLAGKAKLSGTENEMVGNNVIINDINATESYAGGLAGQVESKKLIFGYGNDERQTESVTAKNIKAGKSYAGGFAGNLIATDNVTVCEAVVDVETELSAGEQFAGGLFGQTNTEGKKLINRSADIEIGTLKAAEGFAGGEIGYVEAGNVFVGTKASEGFSNLVTDIDITKLSSAYAAGGVIGGNSNNSTVELSTAKKGTEAEPKNNTISIDVAGWENLKKNDPGFNTYFDPDAADSKSHKAGTHSNVIGYLTGDMNIIIEKDFDGTTPLFVVNDNLDKTAKENVGYKKHTDEQGNIPSGKAYWGDTNGYVGYGNASYKINGQAVIAQGTNGFNLFKTEANYQ